MEEDIEYRHARRQMTDAPFLPLQTPPTSPTSVSTPSSPSPSGLAEDDASIVAATANIDESVEAAMRVAARTENMRTAFGTWRGVADETARRSLSNQAFRMESDASEEDKVPTAIGSARDEKKRVSQDDLNKVATVRVSQDDENKFATVRAYKRVPPTIIPRAESPSEILSGVPSIKDDHLGMMFRLDLSPAQASVTPATATATTTTPASATATTTTPASTPASASATTTTPASEVGLADHALETSSLVSPRVTPPGQ